MAIAKLENRIRSRFAMIFRKIESEVIKQSTKGMEWLLERRN
eukprot:gene1339-2588_t